MQDYTKAQNILDNKDGMVQFADYDEMQLVATQETADGKQWFYVGINQSIDSVFWGVGGGSPVPHSFIIQNTQGQGTSFSTQVNSFLSLLQAKSQNTLDSFYGAFVRFPDLP